MSEKKTVLTFAGLKKKEEELHILKTVRRKEVAEKIKEARAQGDLSENAEYDFAKEEQAEIEANIVLLEKMLRNAEVINEEELENDVVNVGNTVLVYDKAYDEEVRYKIVGSAEADPFNGQISYESPLGLSLIGHKTGDLIKVDTPDGTAEYDIRGIE